MFVEYAPSSNAARVRVIPAYNAVLSKNTLVSNRNTLVRPVLIKGSTDFNYLAVRSGNNMHQVFEKYLATTARCFRKLKSKGFPSSNSKPRLGKGARCPLATNWYLIRGVRRDRLQSVIASFRDFTWLRNHDTSSWKMSAGVNHCEHFQDGRPQCSESVPTLWEVLNQGHATTEPTPSAMKRKKEKQPPHDERISRGSD